MNLGDKILIMPNPENTEKAYVMEVIDVHEVGSLETYYEIEERSLNFVYSKPDKFILN